ncbi:nucleotidyltransferase family protein [Limnobacter humi]|uniref:Nucleotidyltransferase family protein n=1 Tax=Limnobacter humi TaxID=1778671 RepID=A0ABT1WFR4_9BURK|nr:nucleotidyltransferase family protein [Limnobacter humi]MCQ8896315.1 nucleotidyltransferase family protein [Limnobacter humi]
MIVGILLAAGQARRFGSNKLIQPWGSRGEPVLIHSLLSLKASCDQVLVVVGPQNYAELTPWIEQHGCAWTLAPDAHLGMGHSLAHGIANSPPCLGWIIGLADMPAVNCSTTVQLADALKEGHSIAVPVMNQRRGNPVGFSFVHRVSLMQLTGDEGARRLIKTHAGQIHWVEVQDLGIHHDIDQPADLLWPTSVPNQ